MQRQESRIRILPLVAALLIGASAVGFAYYFRAFVATTDPLLLVTDAAVKVESSSLGLSFLPLSGAKDLGLAFYQGARVPPEAYAYLGRAAAAAGYPVVILKTPLNFAVFAPGKAAAAAAALPQVRRWVLGGHSLGGAMAAVRAAKAPESVAGLLFLGAYPGGGTRLSGAAFPVLSISATNDGLATPAKVAAGRKNLPQAARHVVVAGGNHAQFGEYGPQGGDGAADISGAAQRRAVVEETLRLLGEAAARP
ncbi:MAG: hypothetical protein JNG85_17955 [Spirochaetaceae bacterium]|nr:hypothetical protein [Spirochaetaceae bacterium]